MKNSNTIQTDLIDTIANDLLAIGKLYFNKIEVSIRNGVSINDAVSEVRKMVINMIQDMFQKTPEQATSLLRIAKHIAQIDKTGEELMLDDDLLLTIRRAFQ